MPYRPTPLALSIALAIALLGAAAGAGADEKAPVPTSDDRVLYAIGLRGRGHFITSDVLSVALDQSQSILGGSTGFEFVRRKGRFDIVVSADFLFLRAADGNWLASGKDPTLDTHFTHFQNLDFFSLDVSFLYTRDVAPWLALQFGAGLGIGVLTGDVYLVNNAGPGPDGGNGRCVAANAGDPSQCYPIVTPAGYRGGAPHYADGRAIEAGPIPVTQYATDPSVQQRLDGLEQAQAACVAAHPQGGALPEECKDTANHPYWHKAAEKPPVLPVLNIVVGLKFKAHRHLNINVQGGFRNGFFVGLGPEYVF